MIKFKYSKYEGGHSALLITISDSLMSQLNMFDNMYEQLYGNKNLDNQILNQHSIYKFRCRYFEFLFPMKHLTPKMKVGLNF